MEGVLCSSGLLGKHIDDELAIVIKSRSVEEYLDVLSYMIDYILDYQPIIKDGQTIGYYSAHFKFRRMGDKKVLELTEPIDESGENYISGVDDGMMIASAQAYMCEQLEVQPVWPMFDQTVIISKGVYEGEPIEGIRYPPTEHTCGWWLTTDQYDNNTKSLIHVHYYHIVFRRPDILEMLALPQGFFFNTKDGSIGFDEEVSKFVY